eukprot:scaffold220_cov169-Amphora_coffeaeformis.AAC.33
MYLGRVGGLTHYQTRIPTANLQTMQGPPTAPVFALYGLDSRLDWLDSRPDWLDSWPDWLDSRPVTVPIPPDCRPAAAPIVVARPPRIAASVGRWHPRWLCTRRKPPGELRRLTVAVGKIKGRHDSCVCRRKTNQSNTKDALVC